MVRQQAFYRSTADLMDIRSQLRQAEAVMTSDLRSISTAGGDLVAMTDTSMSFRLTIGSSIVCAKPASTTIIVPPLTLATGTILTSWLTRPGTNGDSLFVFDDGASTASLDDRWRQHGISDFVATAGGCPTTSGFTTAPDATSDSYTITTDAAVSATVAIGSPIRFARRAHYSLYRSGTDGRWYLGYCSPACGVGNSIAAIAGPFSDYSTTAAASGMRITYFDSLGVTTAIPNNVARAVVVLRARTEAALTAREMARGTYVDSLRMVIAIRNYR
jgi:hypothetical protein